MNNKLFLTFSSDENLSSLINKIKTDFILKYNKIFILYSLDSDEYACTYNTQDPNVINHIPNTILVHRKKEYNVLYTINSLNSIIRNINGGILNTKLPIPWELYKNSILLTDGDNIKVLRTKIHKIVEI